MIIQMQAVKREKANRFQRDRFLEKKDKERGKFEMKNLIKCIVLIILLVGILFCASALADRTGSCGNSLTWTLSEAGVLTISGTGEMYDFVPWLWDGYLHWNWAPWYEMMEEDPAWPEGYPTFDNICSVIINNGVTSIGAYAFYDCYQLTSVTIPDSVTSIGSQAFAGCGNLTSVTIPDSVTSIGEFAFSGCSSLTSVRIPDSLTRIGQFAFDSDCIVYAQIGSEAALQISKERSFRTPRSKVELQYLYDNNSLKGLQLTRADSEIVECEIPDSVTSIGYSAFSGCSSLTNVTIPDSVTSIGQYAFEGCSNLTSVILPDSVTSIEYGAFSDCSSLSSIIIPDSVKTIGNMVFNSCASLTTIIIPINATIDLSGTGTQGVFENCYALENITLPSQVMSIGDKAFSNCSKLTNITIPDSVTSIGGYAFERCNRLTSVTIPDSVTSIGDYTFEGCSSLTSVTIPDSVTSIGDYTFEGCSSLTSVTIPDSVTSIGENAFNSVGIVYAQIGTEAARQISKVRSFRTPGSKIELQYLYENNTIKGLQLTRTDLDIEECEIPNSVTSIGDYAFEDCSSLTNVMIPDSVTSIGQKAFRGCSSLMNVTIGDSVTSIGDYAFDGCSCLTNVTIPDSVTSVEPSSFSGCSSLTNVTIPDSVTSIGPYAFFGCSSLVNVTIGDSVTKIDAHAFSNCSTLTCVTIPDSVISIGDYTFEGCSSLTSVTIPDSVTSIENYAFQDCSNLMSMTIPDSVTSIGEAAFQNCSSLTSVTIPDSVKSIGQCAFDSVGIVYTQIDSEAASQISRERSFRTLGSNYDLQYIYENNEIKGLRLVGVDSDTEEFEIPNKVTSIGYGAFSNCGNSLTSVTIPDSVTSIDGYAFSGCSKLKSVTIPNGVTSIVSYTFSNCNSLASVTIPDSVTNIETNAFEGCSSLTSVMIPDSVTNIGDYAFSSCYNLTSVTIPNSVTQIGHGAFGYCDNLQKIYIPDAVTGIASDAVTNTPTIYCYAFSDADYWALDRGFPIIYLDEVETEEIRELTLESNFIMACGDTRSIVYTLFPRHDNPMITWTSSSPDIISVNNGIVTAIEPGSAIITASCGSLESRVLIRSYTAATEFSLSDSEIWVLARESYQFIIKDRQPQNAEAFLTWESSDTEYANIDENGLMTTIKPGDVTITATSEKGIKRECLVHLCYPVTAIEMNAPFSRMLVGRDMQMNANVTMRTQECVNHLLTFTSSNEDIATVDPETGLVHAYSTGTVTISAASASKKTASVTIEVQSSCSSHIAAIDHAVAPTCTETGLTEGSHCGICGKVLTAQKTVKALGHDWGEPAYVWKHNRTQVTATKVCSRDESHVYEETVGVQRIATVSPTETAAGTYKLASVTFEDADFQIQERKGGEIPAIGGMKKLSLPAGTKTIEEEAFEGMACQVVVISDGCLSIGSRAFANCGQLVYIKVPANVNIATDAFSGSDLVVIDRLSGN